MIEPVTTMAQLNKLDIDLVCRGYIAGFIEKPDYTQTSQSYWHGFLNGDSDKHPERISDEQRELARVYVESKKAH